jgi:hypothetical protein
VVRPPILLNTSGCLGADWTGHNLQFCLRFERQDRNLGQVDVAPRIVSVEDRFDIAQAMVGERRYLRDGRDGKRKPHDC